MSNQLPKWSETQTGILQEIKREERARARELEERENALKEMVEESGTSAAMIAMSMASDAQELIALGRTEQASELLNEIKMVIANYLATTDEHGRMVKGAKERGAK